MLRLLAALKPASQLNISIGGISAGKDRTMQSLYGSVALPSAQILVDRHVAGNRVGLRGGSYPLHKTVKKTIPRFPKMTPRLAFERNWRLYIFEGVELAIFMISACAFTCLLYTSRCV